MGAMKRLFMEMQEEGVTVLNDYDEMSVAIRHENAINFLFNEISECFQNVFMLTGMSQDELEAKAQEIINEITKEINQ